MYWTEQEIEARKEEMKQISRFQVQDQFDRKLDNQYIFTLLAKVLDRDLYPVSNVRLKYWMHRNQPKTASFTCTLETALSLQVNSKDFPKVWDLDAERWQIPTPLDSYILKNEG